MPSMLPTYGELLAMPSRIDVSIELPSWVATNEYVPTVLLSTDTAPVAVPASARSIVGPKRYAPPVSARAHHSQPATMTYTYGGRLSQRLSMAVVAVAASAGYALAWALQNYF